MNLVILSNVPGLLRTVDDEASLIERIEPSALDEYFDYAKGRMKRKAPGCQGGADGRGRTGHSW